MSQDDFGLLNTTETSYGDKYKEHLLEQYKLFIQMADKISDRRATANSFYLSLNSFLLTILGILPQLKSNIIEFTLLWIIIVSAGGIVFCISWIRIIETYKRLNSAKFKVILAIEGNLPAKMYSAEKNHLKAMMHSTLSSNEKFIPIIIIALYALLALGGSLVSLQLLQLPFTASNQPN